MGENRFKHSIKTNMMALTLTAVVPLLLASVYLLISIKTVSSAYDEIVNKMTVANSYNLNFKDEMDESLYKLVVGYVTFNSIDLDPSLKNPYDEINSLRRDFKDLRNITRDENSKAWLSSLLHNIDSLESRVQEIEGNLAEGGHYDENIKILDDSIYILTELIQDDIQYYIYYQTRSIESLQSQINQSVTQFTMVTSIMLVAILLLIILIASSIVTETARPIKDLCEVSKKLAEGDFSVRSQNQSFDEIGQLSDSFNNMAEDLEGMVVKIKDDERKMRDTEIRLLQEQINPHFLYNALDTIVWLVEARETEKAVNMVMSLSSFFRLVLSHGKDFISIQDEELHIKSYLEIQKIRYADIMDFTININPEIYNYKILKLTLQPIVENALYHGIKYKRAKGTISVLGYKDGDLVKLVVTDDGVGMDETKLAVLRSNIQRPCAQTDEGFGLANVNERIRMNFGEQYGMAVDSQKGRGTTVIVTIPAIFATRGESVKNEQA